MFNFSFPVSNSLVRDAEILPGWASLIAQMVKKLPAM